MSDSLKDCFKSNSKNPYMNYLNVGSNVLKKQNCKTKDNQLQETFYKGSILRPEELKLNDTYSRNFNINSVNTVVNDQTSFAKYLYPNTSKCRDDGYLCKINTNISKRKDRTIIKSNNYEPEYLNIFGKYNSYK